MELEKYRNSEITEYVNNYEVLLLHKIEYARSSNVIYNYDDSKKTLISVEDGKELDYRQIEIDFLTDLKDYHQKRNSLFYEYQEHCRLRGKEATLDIIDFSHNMKMHFIQRRLENLNVYVDIGKHLNPPPKLQKQKINGKPLNISERFQIVNQSLGIWKNINSKKIPELKKYELLALTLGINEDNARKIVLGNYDSKDRPELIADYLKELE